MRKFNINAGLTSVSTSVSVLMVASVLCGFSEITAAAPLNFAPGTATILVLPNPAGVAFSGIDGTHAGTQQFVAIEMLANGAVNPSATFRWTSSDPTKARINSSSGLATGVAATTMPITITAKDVSNSSIIGTATLTVKKIGDVIASAGNGLVYCMGTGTDITNCPYLPAGKIGGVIAAADASNNGDAVWDDTFPTNPPSYPPTNAISPNNGAANTALLTDSRYDAANLCTGGFYLPAVDELAVVSQNAVALNASSPSAGLIMDFYWSSTENTTTLGTDPRSPANTFAWGVIFGDSSQENDDKYNSGSVRCVRTF